MFSSNTSQTSGGYEIQRSLRFNSADSAYLSRTPASAGNRKTWTWSGWVKRTKLGVRQGFFSCQTGVALQFGFLDTDVFQMGTLAAYVLQSTQVFRDPSAWYHVVVNVDTTLASNRCKVYINGTQITAWGTNIFDSTIGQNVDTAINQAADHFLGQIGPNLSYLDGYMTEVNFIDGQALTPSSFGAFDAQTGVWGPTPYAGSYGTNGFYLNFSDNSNTTAATLGKDYSGNGNNWTPNNFSVSAGAGNDSLVDVPTNWGTDTGVGGSVRGNYATLNPLDKSTNASAVNGNLDATSTGGSWVGIRATLGMQTGKWYCEYTPTSGTFHIVSVSQPQAPTTAYIIDSPFAWGYQWDGTKVTNSAPSSYGSGWGVGDIIGIAFDADAGTITFYKNNVSQGVAFSGLTSGPYIVGLGFYPTATGTFNFGQRPFAYTAPSGFKALNTQNLPTPTIGATTATQAGKFFNPVLYTGNGSTNSITGVGFQPDWTWIKSRSTTSVQANHFATDILRGAGIGLYPNLTDAEANNTSLFTGFTSNGFNVAGTNSSLNENGVAYVGWNWKANGAGVTNTAGSITSTVSANTTSGFSVVTYTGSGAAATVGHGLSAAPRMIIVKARNTAGLSWLTYHQSIGATQFLLLNTADGASTNPAAWNDTAPTTTVFTAGTGSSVNGSGTTYVAYCFAEVPGYSRFGSYVGNGSADGPFVFCGFRPAYVMVKGTSSGANATFWLIFDSKRNTYNLADSYLAANTSDTETQNPTVVSIDMLSNGFKVRSSNTSFGTNQPNNVYVFAAFAEAPQKFALAR